MNTYELSSYLDTMLSIHDIDDASLNGLQVDNSGKTGIVSCAVDASLETFKEAEKRKSRFLIVHHGIFWGKPSAIRNAMYTRIKFLLDNDIALYAAHLPIDIHQQFGNNSQIQDVLGWPMYGDFGVYKGIPMGKLFHLPEEKSLRRLEDEISEKLDVKPIVWPFGRDKIQTIAYVSGGAISMLQQAIDMNVDLYITGEPAHSAFWQAREAGLNVMFAGHYATETLGVKAVARHLEEKFGIKTEFIDLPTGY